MDRMMHDLSGGEWKVLLYLSRRTVGFGKPSDAISLAQFSGGIRTRAGRQLDEGTGLDRNSGVLP
jgi:hypothetical protein